MKPITHEEAKQALLRLKNTCFGTGTPARWSIPPDPERDDDLRLLTYIAANESRDAAAIAALEKCKEVMSAANIDIGHHVSVARYNLTGMTQTGDQLPIPDPPLLVHAKGIRDSEMVRALLCEGLRAISAALASLKPGATQQ